MGIEHLRPDLIFVSGVAAAAAGAALLWHRSAHPLLFAVRCTILCVLLLLLLEPVLVRYDTRARPVVAVACDVSPSMHLSGRLERVQRFIRDTHGELERRFDVRYYAFASTSGVVKKTDALKGLRFGATTDLDRSLREIRRETGERLSGVLLLSDAHHTADPVDGTWARTLNVPLFPVMLEVQGKIKDAAVRSLKVSDFAFKNTPVDVVASVGVRGGGGETVTVQLKDGKGTVLAGRSFAAGSDDDVREVPLRFVPPSGGEFRYTVEVLTLPGERIASNNRKEFALEVVRDKLRVLYLCGQPGFEYSFLRHSLKSDPLVELVSFVILRNPENIALVAENDLALIPFPVHTLFTRDIHDFDALILENFTYRRFGFLPEYLENIRRWVEEKGGGLVMVGGVNSFASGGWAGTPVGAMLPVSLEGSQEQFSEGLFRPVAENRRHFIMTLDDDEGRNEALWRTLPELDGCQMLGRKEGAEVLARHPFGNWPVIAAGEQGKGRVVALGANTTWRWALGSSAPGAYTRFWRNVIRYLTRSGESEQLRLAFDRQEYNAGDAFLCRLLAGGKNGDSRVVVEMVSPSGRRHGLPAVRQGEADWTVQGVFDEPGEYVVRATLEGKGFAPVRVTRKRAVAESTAKEEAFLDLNRQLAADLAAGSGGEVLDPAAFSAKELAAKLAARGEKRVVRKIPLWPSPWALILVIAALFTEWFFRKRLGYL